MPVRAMGISPSGFYQDLMLRMNINSSVIGMWGCEVNPDRNPIQYGMIGSGSFYLNSGDRISFQAGIRNTSGGSYQWQCDGITPITITGSPS
jgi:hypothetical protein